MRWGAVWGTDSSLSQTLWSMRACAPNGLLYAFEGLAEVPGKGHKRPDLTNHDVLFFSVYQYPIAYRRTRLVEIAAVLHGKRDAKRLPATRTAL